jgi:hypothetical protein
VVMNTDFTTFLDEVHLIGTVVDVVIVILGVPEHGFAGVSTGWERAIVEETGEHHAGVGADLRRKGQAFS